MTLTLQDLRDRVRQQMDLDDVDLPNVQLDFFINLAFEQAINLESRWPFYQTSWSVPVLASATTLIIPTDAVELDTVLVPTGRLIQIDQREGEQYFGAPSAWAGTPFYWARLGSVLSIWPYPSADTTFTLRGYRRSSDWVSSGAATVVDADVRLHMPIFYLACSLAYAQQEDEVLAAQYLNWYQQAIASARAAIMRPWTRDPLVLGSGLLPNNQMVAPAQFSLATSTDLDGDDVDGGSA